MATIPALFKQNRASVIATTRVACNAAMAIALPLTAKNTAENVTTSVAKTASADSIKATNTVANVMITSKNVALANAILMSTPTPNTAEHVFENVAQTKNVMMANVYAKISTYPAIKVI